jgi:putative membrane protein
MRTSISKTFLATTIFCLGGALTTQYALAQKSDTAGAAKASAADMKFAREAAMGGMMEVELGKVATQKASTDKVKQFGQKMVDDHSKANDELKSTAAKNNITLPGDLDAKHKAIVDKYSAMSGTAFDRAYMRDMVKDHTTDVAEFQKEANSGSNPDLKTFAGSTLPTLQEHLKMAKDTNSSLTSTSSR